MSRVQEVIGSMTIGSMGYLITYKWGKLDPSVFFGEMDGVSKNRGSPKWMVYNGKPYVFPYFWVDTQVLLSVFWIHLVLRSWRNVPFEPMRWKPRWVLQRAPTSSRRLVGRCLGVPKNAGGFWDA